MKEISMVDLADAQVEQRKQLALTSIVEHLATLNKTMDEISVTIQRYVETMERPTVDDIDERLDQARSRRASGG
jgi:hypothetical protein